MPVGRSSVVDVVDRGEGVVHCPEGRSSTLPGSNQLPSLSPSLLRSGVASPEADPALGTFRARVRVRSSLVFPHSGKFRRPTDRATDKAPSSARDHGDHRARARARAAKLNGGTAGAAPLSAEAGTQARTHLPLARRRRRGGGRDRQSCRTDIQTADALLSLKKYFALLSQGIF